MYETWYRQVKETKRGEMHVRKSEQPDSTVEVGELSPKGVGGGKRVVSVLDRDLEIHQMLEIWKMYQRQSRG
jgi:hypothetical protein